MTYFAICIMPMIFLFINGLKYKHFNWEDLPSECGTTVHDNTYYDHSDSWDNLAKVGEFPWLARIGLRDKDTHDIFFYCTGSLIHVDYVITAAHCGKQSKLVRLGETNLISDIDCYKDTCAPPPQDIEIKQHIFAEHCRLTNTNDLSILVLKQPAKLNDFVRPICFPRGIIPRDELKNEVMIVAGWSVVYSGWGTVHGSNYTAVKDLKEIFSLVVDSGLCKDIYKRDLQDSELCVEHQERVKDPCVVDSGGPIVSYVGAENRAYLIGIASHNLLQCHMGQTPIFVYTNVSYFADWLLMRLNQWIVWGA